MIFTNLPPFLFSKSFPQRVKTTLRENLTKKSYGVLKKSGKRSENGKRSNCNRRRTCWDCSCLVSSKKWK